MTKMTELRDAMPLAAKLGIEIEEATPARVRGCLVWAGGIMHGGALMALADSLGGICAFLNLSEGARTATISSSTNMFRAVTDRHVMAEAAILHAGRSVIVVQTNIYDPDQRLVAQVTQTQAVIDARA
jgi:1,4-dihydroxy-2-naphthoyl-CoA hydrolase